MTKQLITILSTALACSALAANMASQPWVNMRIEQQESNTQAVVDQKIDELHTNILDEVSKIVPGGQDYNPDTDMWIEDGTNLCFLVNGVKVVNVIKSIETSREVPGFFVVSEGNSNGAVSNGMFYAEVSNGRFFCPSNRRIPYIEFDGLATQVVNGVTNEYQNLKIVETRTPTNGMPYSVRWVSTQRNNIDFWCIDDGDPSWEEPKVFMIRMTYGPAFNDYGSSDVSLFDRLFSAYAGSYSVDIEGLSGSVTMVVTDTEGTDHTFEIPIAFKFQDDEMSQWWKEPFDVDNDEYIEHHTFQPNPGIPYDAFSQLGRWIDSSISYSYVLSDGTVISKTIPLAQITKLLGTQFQAAIQKAWSEQKEIIWNEQKPDQCAAGNHYYVAETCKCRKCGKSRPHKFPDVFSGEKCKQCINLVGYVNKPTSSECGGYSTSDIDHTGYHHTPSAGWYDPYEKQGHHPLLSGFAKTCTCTCGRMKGNHDADEVYYYVAGNLIGDQENNFHTEVLKCNRYSSQSFGEFGWRAVVKGHKVDKSQRYEFDCYVAGSYDTKTGMYTPCETYSADVDKSYHAAIGHCSLCDHDVRGRTAHNDDDSNCVCDDCGAILHDLDWDERCPNIIYCRVCGKAFQSDGQGDAVRPFVQLSDDDIVVSHTYGEAIPQNYVFHTCLCKRKIHHDHTWIGKEGGFEGEEVCGDAPDGTAGCGMERSHDAQGCDSEKCVPCGDCTTGWFCRLCGKDISDYEGAPPKHHGNSTDKAFEPEKENGRIVFCAVCTHSFRYGENNASKVRCGTKSDGSFTPTRIHDESVHGLPPCSWKPMGGTFGERDTYHECSCGAYTRFHNWNDYQAVDINDRYHRILRECNLERFDDCHLKGSYEEKHNFKPQINSQTGLPSYSRNPNNEDECGVMTICKTVAAGKDIGCNRAEMSYGSHEWHPLEDVGKARRYTWASPEKGNHRYHYHVHNMECAHFARGIDRQMHACGCSTPRPIDDYFYEVGYPGASLHTKVYESAYKNTEYHTTTTSCDKKDEGCYFSEADDNPHTYRFLDWEYLDNDTHRKSEVCVGKYNYDPGCGHTNKTEDARHSGELLEISFADDRTHIKSYWCDQCNHSYFVQEDHERVDDPFDEWDACEYSQLITNVQFKCVSGSHVYQNFCRECNNWYSAEFPSPCVYNTLEDEGNLMDSMTCVLCGETVKQICHAKSIGGGETVGILKLDDIYHGCYHMVETSIGTEITPSHRRGMHNKDGWTDPDTQEFHEEWCSVCGYSYGKDSKKLKLTMPSLYPESLQEALDDIGLKGMASSWNPPLEVVDGDEPVYNIDEFTLREFFKDCTSLLDVKFNFVTNVGQSALYNAFNGCSSLRSVQFRDLKTIHRAAFKDAFKNCNRISINWPSVVSIDEGAFSGCDSLCEVRMAVATDFGALGSRFIGEFEECRSLTNAVFNLAHDFNGYTFRDTPMESLTVGCTTNHLYESESFPWGLRPGCRVKCSNGTVVVPSVGNWEYVGLPSDVTPGTLTFEPLLGPSGWMVTLSDGTQCYAYQQVYLASELSFSGRNDESGREYSFTAKRVR